MNKKRQFIIVRVTIEEKESIVEKALKAKQRLSTFVRKTLGLE